MRPFAMLALLSMAACKPTPPTPQRLIVPKALYASSKSHWGPNWEVSLAAGAGEITWTYDKDGGTATITEDKWKAFRAALDEAKAFELQPLYDDQANDGGDQIFSVDFGDRAVTSKYRGGTAPASYGAVMRAVNELTGNQLQ